MNNSSLKTIAIVTMLIDHIGAILLPQFFVLRMIGRIAFPIFAFLLVEGMFRTSDQKRYLTRLFMFALISEVPYDFGFFNQVFTIEHQNIFFTLFLGLCAMMIVEQVKRKVEDTAGQLIASGFIVVGIGVISEFLHTDYGFVGIVTILLFYFLRGDRVRALLAVGGFHIFIGLASAGFPDITNAAYAVQALAALSMPLLYFYNGQKGWSLKYVFYYFYPVHILVLAGINQLLITH